MIRPPVPPGGTQRGTGIGLATALEALREPLDSGVARLALPKADVGISRTVASALRMFGDPRGRCRYAVERAARSVYRAQLCML